MIKKYPGRDTQWGKKMITEKRSKIRNKVWPETEATLTFALLSNAIKVIKVNIDNLGSQGMFVITNVELPINTKLKILIDFQPGNAPEISLRAEGIVLRSESEGFAVLFTQIDTQELGDCIIKKMRLGSVGVNCPNSRKFGSVSKIKKKVLYKRVIYKYG
jgi:hypothetical protein